jgi:class 3 adenylate cyclase
MAVFRSSKRDLIPVTSKGQKRFALRQEVLDRFGPGVLGLGDLSRRAKSIDAVCAIFDLAGFTQFCQQVDPHLEVPKFLHHFTTWLFDEIKRESINRHTRRGVIVWTRMPFFAKFMGDGVLLLWNADHIGEICGVLNVPIVLNEVCTAYATQFLPMIRAKVARVPAILRCGIARGQVYSVGNANDFIGPCINIAARLQKITPGISFCFSARGLDFDEYHGIPPTIFTLKKLRIRGIGDDEPVHIRQDEFDALPRNEKRLFAEP